MDRFNLMQVFVRIAETGSISAVAREVGATQPTMSKQLAALEARLGVTLLQRTTRRLSLTEAGSAYYESARRILDQVAEAEAGVGRLSSGPTGILTVSAPNGLGQMFLDRLIIAFQSRYPELRIHLIESERFVDLVEEGIDVAVRVGQLTDSTLVARRLGSSRRVVVGTPEYFARYPDRGCPRISSAIPASSIPTWRRATSGDSRARRAKSTCAYRASSAPPAAMRSARPSWPASAWPRHRSGWCTITCAPGVCRRCCSDYAPSPAEINAVYPSARHVATKVRVFIDYLREAFGRVPRTDLASRGSGRGRRLVRFEVEFHARSARVEAEELPDPRFILPPQVVGDAPGLELRGHRREVGGAERHVVEDAARIRRERPTCDHVKHRLAIDVQPSAGKSEVWPGTFREAQHADVEITRRGQIRGREP